VVWRTSPAVGVPFSVVAVGEAEVGLHLEQTVREPALFWRKHALDDLQGFGEISPGDRLKRLGDR
jgi:hypothetical protein